MYSNNPFSYNDSVSRAASATLMLNERKLSKNDAMDEAEFRDYFNTSIRPQIPKSQIHDEWKFMIQLFKEQGAVKSDASEWELPEV